jgi:hypothetical protein
MENAKHPGRAKEWYNFAERLSNYISMQESVAKSKGVWDQLKKAKTLTQARKIVYGVKGKNSTL